jgi:hypothetical protein
MRKHIIAAKHAKIGSAFTNVPGSAGQIHLTLAIKSGTSLLMVHSKVFSLQSTQK